MSAADIVALGDTRPAATLADMKRRRDEVVARIERLQQQMDCSATSVLRAEIATRQSSQPRRHRAQQPVHVGATR